MDRKQESHSPVETNYFVCTLGQAAEYNTANQHSWRAINEFIDHQARDYPDRPAVGFPIPPDGKNQHSGWDFTIYTFEDLRRISLSYAGASKRSFSGRKNSQTVGLLCSSSVEFLFGWLGLMRCGHSVLLIAPQCQPSAIAHLCRECQVSILVSDGDHLDLAKVACESLDQSAAVEPVSLPEVKNDSNITGSPTEIWPVSDTEVAYLHHTSGTSTGLPKPIAQTHRAAVGVLPSLNNGKETATFTTTPLYHGGVADCFRSWTSGAMIWFFPGREVPITSSNIIKSLDCARFATQKHNAPNVRYFSSVPYVLQMLAAEAEGLKLLKEMKLVGVGGAALPPSVGDDLVQYGVNLVSRFGSAECGFLMSSHRDYAVDKEWQYLRSNGSSHLSFEPRDGGLSELIILPTWPHMAKRNRDDGSCATADLFEPHPAIPDAWRYHSRADSQITLITGKKFDPAPLEAAIATSSLLSDCLIFGNGQQYPGALLFRSPSSANMTGEEVLDVVWPMVWKLNSESQAHTRLSKSMLVVMPRDAPGLEKSSKGTTMRAAAEKKYTTEISKAYEGKINTATNGNKDGNGTAFVPDENVPTAVLQIIKEIVGTENAIPEEADLFSFGVDSVMCMQIRASLQSKLLAANAPKLPLNVVYDCGTIRKLAKHLLTLRRGGNLEREDEIGQMQTLVSEYSTFKIDLTPTSDTACTSSNGVPGPSSNGQVVILTGATGALGAHILDQLRASPRVSKIHCLVRAASLAAARERVSKSLVTRNKAPLVDETPYSRITCHPCKLSEPRLGFESAPAYESLASHATVIIHAAWAVNFSMRLASFVKDHIAGLRNLMSFALASPRPSPPRFVFCSSTASVLSPNTTSPIPETISHDPLSASPLGYSRSKWVAEAICEQAHLNTRLQDRISVLRIGQLCGDTKSGIWNVTEAWPLMLSSVRITGSLPDLKEPLDWLPVDVAAQAVLEIAMSPGRAGEYTSNKAAKEGTGNVEVDEISVFHILNPNTQSTWLDLLHWLQKLAPDFKIISPAAWVSRLDNLRGNEVKHPARKLLGLWKDAYAGDVKEEARKGVSFEMERTKRAVSVMRDVQPIGERQFEKIWAWIEREMIKKDKQEDA